MQTKINKKLFDDITSDEFNLKATVQDLKKTVPNIYNLITASGNFTTADLPPMGLICNFDDVNQGAVYITINGGSQIPVLDKAGAELAANVIVADYNYPILYDGINFIINLEQEFTNVVKSFNATLPIPASGDYDYEDFINHNIKWGNNKILKASGLPFPVVLKDAKYDQQIDEEFNLSYGILDWEVNDEAINMSLDFPEANQKFVTSYIKTTPFSNDPDCATLAATTKIKSTDWKRVETSVSTSQCHTATFMVMLYPDNTRNKFKLYKKDGTEFNFGLCINIEGLVAQNEHDRVPNVPYFTMIPLLDLSTNPPMVNKMAARGSDTTTGRYGETNNNAKIYLRDYMAVNVRPWLCLGRGFGNSCYVRSYIAYNQNRITAVTNACDYETNLDGLKSYGRAISNQTITEVGGIKEVNGVRTPPKEFIITRPYYTRSGSAFNLKVEVYSPNRDDISQLVLQYI